MPSPKRERLIYEEKYRKGAMKVRESLLPDRLPYMSEDVERVVSMEMRACGRVDRDGEELEYQDVRIYTKMKGGSDGR